MPCGDPAPCKESARLPQGAKLEDGRTVESLELRPGEFLVAVEMRKKQKRSRPEFSARDAAARPAAPEGPPTAPPPAAAERSEQRINSGI